MGRIAVQRLMTVQKISQKGTSQDTMPSYGTVRTRIHVTQYTAFLSDVDWRNALKSSSMSGSGTNVGRLQPSAMAMLRRILYLSAVV